MPTNRATILLTRPQEQAERFARMCRDMLGAEQQIILSPLIKIEMLPMQESLAHYCGLIFTSENGVRAFAQAYGQHDMSAYCVGERTAQAAHAAGLRAYSANGSADDLVAMVKGADVRGALLHIRGEHSRGDIAGRLGQQVDEVVAYRQVSVPLSEEAREILAGEHKVILPLFSPRTAQLFFTQDLQINASLQVVAISNAVNEAILGTNLAKSIDIFIAETPDAEAMLRTIKRRIDT